MEDTQIEGTLLAPCPPPSMPLQHAAWLRHWQRHAQRASERTRHIDGVCELAKVVGVIGPTLPRWARAQTPSRRREAMAPALVHAVESYDWKTGLLLLGTTGSGKTTGLVHLLLSGWERAFSAFQTPPRAMLVKAIELGACRRCHPLGEGEPGLFVDAVGVGLLLLDDLGQDEKRDNVIFDVLDARYDAGLPTVVTSGYPPEWLSDRYGQALVRRIIETNGDGKIVNLFKKARALGVVK